MLCKACQETNNIAGQEITYWQCEKCEKIFIYENTDTPRVCQPCSEKYHTCEKCGKDIK